MTKAERGGVAEVCERLASELTAAGAECVLLMGSHATGSAVEHSDIDLLAVGSGVSRMRVAHGWLLSEQWCTIDQIRRSFQDPGAVGSVVPGWRTAEVLKDPKGVGAQLVSEAITWSWGRLGDAPDRWVRDAVVGYCEEVHRLVGQLGAGRLMSAAFVRSVLALRCAKIMAVHLRLMYGSENVLWSQVAEALGEEWLLAQRAAFGFGGEDVVESAQAALRLFELMAHATSGLLDDEQGAVVGLALDTIASSRGCEGNE